MHKLGLFKCNNHTSKIFHRCLLDRNLLTIQEVIKHARSPKLKVKSCCILILLNDNGNNNYAIGCEDMAVLLSPRQLVLRIAGWCRGGAEAAVHATQKYLQNISSKNALLKLDFRNAFNSILRDKVLEAVRDLAQISTY